MASKEARLTVALIAAMMGASASAAYAASPAEKVFTVANYPVEATAQDAVAAKEKALAEGQQAAFRSLLKRLVPVTAYRSLTQLRTVTASNMVEGLAVRSEQNSSTEYIATLDFSFEPKAIRDLLRREGIPFIDVQAPQVVVIPIYLAPSAAAGAQLPAALGAASAGKTWTDLWKGLDLEHTLAPVKLEPAKAELTPDAVKAALVSPEAALNLISRVNKSNFVLLAVAEPNLSAKRLQVTLAGQDSVGGFVLTRSYRFDPDDFAYTAELSAVVALGILEGRWKAANSASVRVADTVRAGGLEEVHLFIEFRNMQEWQDIRSRIAGTPGVEGFDVSGLSARGADAALRYPGGGEELAEALTSKSLRLTNVGGTWIVRSAH